MIAATKKLLNLFTTCLEAKNSSSSPANCFLLEYQQKNDVSSSLLPKIDDNKLMEKCSLSSPVSLGKRKLQSFSCAPNFQLRVVS